MQLNAEEVRDALPWDLAIEARFLSREDGREMMIGAGCMGRRLILAHMSVRPIRRIGVWDCNETAAGSLVAGELRAKSA